MGKVVQFPISKEYEKFIQDSGVRTRALIETLSLSHEKGMLNERAFYYFLEYLNVDLHRDFTPSDLAIIKFHCDNYYNLPLSVW